MPLAMLQLPARIGFARPSVRTATVTRAMANVSTETSAKKEEEGVHRCLVLF